MSDTVATACLVAEFADSQIEFAPVVCVAPQDVRLAVAVVIAGTRDFGQRSGCVVSTCFSALVGRRPDQLHPYSRCATGCRHDHRQCSRRNRPFPGQVGDGGHRLLGRQFAESQIEFAPVLPLRHRMSDLPSPLKSYRVSARRHPLMVIVPDMPTRRRRHAPRSGKVDPAFGKVTVADRMRCSGSRCRLLRRSRWRSGTPSPRRDPEATLWKPPSFVNVTVSPALMVRVWARRSGWASPSRHGSAAAASAGHDRPNTTAEQAPATALRRRLAEARDWFVLIACMAHLEADWMLRRQYRLAGRGPGTSRFALMRDCAWQVHSFRRIEASIRRTVGFRNRRLCILAALHPLPAGKEHAQYPTAAVDRAVVGSRASTCLDAAAEVVYRGTNAWIPSARKPGRCTISPRPA